MSLLELRIPKNSDDGYFETKIVYLEKAFETTLSVFFGSIYHLPVDFFANASNLTVLYDDEPIDLPEDISFNLLKYLTGFNRLYNLHTQFTCHQFAFMLQTDAFVEDYGMELNTSQESQQTPGDIVQFVNQTSEFGMRQNAEFIHSAVSLGNGLYFSKNGKLHPGIYTLEALLAVYPCDYLTVVSKIYLEPNHISSKSSIHRSFRNKTYLRNGLAYRALNTNCESPGQLSPQAINTLYRHASRHFHPDKTNLPQEQAEVFLGLTQRIFNFLSDPIIRSEYNVSLLAGNDWSVARILNLSFESLHASSVIADFEAFIALLKHYGRFTPAEEQKIKSEPRYKQALSQVPDFHSSDIVIHIGNDVDRLINQDPYLPTSVSFGGTKKYLSDTLHFPRHTRIGGLRMYTGNGLAIRFNIHTFNEQSMQSDEFKELPPGLIDYLDIIKGLELYSDYIKELELQAASKDSQAPIFLNPDYTRKRHLIQHQNNFIYLTDSQTRLIHLSVYLGGNFYLSNIDLKGGVAYIANVAWLQQHDQLSQLWSLTDKDMVAPHQLKSAKKLNVAEAESLPRLSREQAESFKHYLLSFQASKEYQFPAYLHGYKLQKTNTIQYNVDPHHSQSVLKQGQSVVFCKGKRRVTEAVYLGNYLFLLASTTGYLRVANMLMLSETADWDTLFAVQPITAQGDDKYACEIIKYREKVKFEQIQQPLLYELLGIPFDLTNLSMITEQVVIEHYERHVQNESNPDVLRVLNCAYKLLMNDYYRAFYGSEILFGGEPELNVYTLLNFTKSTPPVDIAKGYTACLGLISNKALKERVANEPEFEWARKDATATFIEYLPAPVTNDSTWEQRKGWRLGADCELSLESVLAKCPQARVAFEQLETQFQLQKIDIGKLSSVSRDKLLNYLWEKVKPQFAELSMKTNNTDRHGASQYGTSARSIFSAPLTNNEAAWTDNHNNLEFLIQNHNR
ncbi:hypothetical protein Lbir_0076 [Legionella birminghamensis]|uniref:J domain-containing protein n=2 Tax=Legionella birminghamensis TaxID=28083 RepID=A0A378IIZ1_9GAMM|nr:hypothetical protein Lbir_0076 [Legionella birminghamensis]STX32134.1 Uncharacterised protein [Legionella birminghamensis]